MNQATKIFNNITLRNKLLLINIFVVFLPVLAVGIILTSGMSRIALDQTMSQVYESINNIDRQIEKTLRISVDLADILYLDKDLKYVISKEYASALDVLDAYNDYGKLNEYLMKYREINRIKVYAQNPKLFNSGQFRRVSDDIINTTWYTNALNSNGKSTWYYGKGELQKESGLSLVRALKNRTGDFLGVIVIDVNNDMLNSILRDQIFNTMLVNHEGYIVAAKDMNLVGHKNEEIGIDNEIIKESGKISQIIFNDKMSKIIVADLKIGEYGKDFKIVSIFPIDVIVGESNKMGILGFTVIALSLLASLILIYFLSSVISERVKLLIGDMHKVALGDFDVESNIHGNDEIGQLSRDLNVMIKSIKELIHEVYDIKLQRKQLIIRQNEIRFKMLANQINPHFLYNVLETIKMKALCNSTEEIPVIVQLLSKIMRTNLELKSDFILLSSEIDHVLAYLKIQKYRYREKLNFSISVPDESNSYYILPLIIQPIVENAVIHGIENKIGSASISIDVQFRNDLLVVTIMDDGLGMNEETLESVIKSLNVTEDYLGKRIGLSNIHQRIKICYGDDYGLEISSTARQGTTVRLLLPGRSEVNCIRF